MPHQMTLVQAAHLSHEDIPVCWQEEAERRAEELSDRKRLHEAATSLDGASVRDSAAWARCRDLLPPRKRRSFSVDHYVGSLYAVEVFAKYGFLLVR